MVVYGHLCRYVASSVMTTTRHMLPCPLLWLELRCFVPTGPTPTWHRHRVCPSALFPTAFIPVRASPLAFQAWRVRDCSPLFVQPLPQVNVMCKPRYVRLPLEVRARLVARTWARHLLRSRTSSSLTLPSGL